MGGSRGRSGLECCVEGMLAAENVGGPGHASYKPIYYIVAKSGSLGKFTVGNRSCVCYGNTPRYVVVCADAYHGA